MPGIPPWWVICHDDTPTKQSPSHVMCHHVRVKACGLSLPYLSRRCGSHPHTSPPCLFLCLTHFSHSSHPTVSKRSKHSTFPFHLSNNTCTSAMNGSGANNFLFLVKIGRRTLISLYLEGQRRFSHSFQLRNFQHFSTNLLAPQHVCD